MSFLQKVKVLAASKAVKFGSDNKYNYGVKLDGVDSDFYTKPFGRQLEEFKTVKTFTSKAKSEHVDAKGKSTLTAVKKWVKENNPKQFFAKWQKDTSSYKDDSVEVFYM